MTIPADALAAIRAFVNDVANQTPEKPDYWSACGQCDRNIDAAQDLRDALAALPLPSDAQALERVRLPESYTGSFLIGDENGATITFQFSDQTQADAWHAAITDTVTT